MEKESKTQDEEETNPVLTCEDKNETPISSLDENDGVVADETDNMKENQETALGRFIGWCKTFQNRSIVRFGGLKKNLIPGLEELDSRISKLETMESALSELSVSIETLGKKIEDLSATVKGYQSDTEKNLISLSNNNDKLQIDLAGRIGCQIDEIGNSYDSNISDFRVEVKDAIDDMKRQLDQTNVQVNRLTTAIKEANVAVGKIYEPQNVGSNFAEAFRNGFSKALENMPWLAQIRNILGKSGSELDSNTMKGIKALVVANVRMREIREGDAFDSRIMTITSKEKTAEPEKVGSIKPVGDPTYYTVWDDNIGEQTLMKARVVLMIGEEE